MSSTLKKFEKYKGIYDKEFKRIKEHWRGTRLRPRCRGARMLREDIRGFMKSWSDP